MIAYIHKKTWSSLSAPRLEVFALPPFWNSNRSPRHMYLTLIYAYSKRYLRALIHTHEHSTLHALRMVPKSCEVSRLQNKHSTERSYVFMLSRCCGLNKSGFRPPSSELCPSPSPNTLTAWARCAGFRSLHDHHITMTVQRYDYFLEYANFIWFFGKILRQGLR